MNTLLSFEKKAYHIVVMDSGSMDYGEIMDEMVNASSKGFRKFTIHVISKTKSPLYLEKLRSLIQNNIAYTITIRHHNYGEEEVKKMLNELKNLPHKVLKK